MKNEHHETFFFDRKIPFLTAEIIEYLRAIILMQLSDKTPLYNSAL